MSGEVFPAMLQIRRYASAPESFKKGCITLIWEIIEGRTAEFVAEAVRYDQVPAYGSFVRVRDGGCGYAALFRGLIQAAWTA